MRIRYLNPMRLLNPAWSQAAADRAADEGVAYDVPQFLEFKSGFEIDDPQAWIHCCPGDMNSAPIAEPVDDECRAEVKKWMEVYRPAGIAAIKAQLEQIDSLTNPQDRRRLMDLGRAYGLIGTKTERTSSAAAVADSRDTADAS